MALFPRYEESDDEFVGGSDAATRALSVAAVETDFVEAVYKKISSVYDYTFGPTLHPGRLTAIRRLGAKSGDHILEVGVGTGINLPLYPSGCRLTGVDLSTSMLLKARNRILRCGVRDARLLQMDAAAMTFPDNTFDIVYAPYLISVVPDPVKVASEMVRVCRMGGRIVVLNHFRSSNRLVSLVERAITPFTVHIGFKSDLDLPGFLTQAHLQPDSIEKVNIPRIWSLVTIIKR